MEGPNLIMGLVGIAALVVLGLLWWSRKSEPAAHALPAEWAITARPVFSTDERRVYRQLREAMPHHVVLSKLPLVRFCQPNDSKDVRYWYELLGSIHVTFAICSANGRVLAAIDLDNDRSTSRRTARIKQSVLNACRVRYLRCPADHLPSVPELQLLVPQSSASARGPQPAPVSLGVGMAAPAPSPAPATPAVSSPRRRERVTLWQDSSLFQDSFFAPDNRGDGPASSEAAASASPGTAPAAGEARSNALAGRASAVTLSPDDVGGVVVDEPAEPVQSSRR